MRNLSTTIKAITAGLMLQFSPLELEAQNMDNSEYQSIEEAIEDITNYYGFEDIVFDTFTPSRVGYTVVGELVTDNQKLTQLNRLNRYIRLFPKEVIKNSNVRTLGLYSLLGELNVEGEIVEGEMEWAAGSYSQPLHHILLTSMESIDHELIHALHLSSWQNASAFDYIEEEWTKHSAQHYGDETKRNQGFTEIYGQTNLKEHIATTGDISNLLDILYKAKNDTLLQKYITLITDHKWDFENKQCLSLLTSEEKRKLVPDLKEHHAPEYYYSKPWMLGISSLLKHTEEMSNTDPAIPILMDVEYWNDLITEQKIEAQQGFLRRDQFIITREYWERKREKYREIELYGMYFANKQTRPPIMDEFYNNENNSYHLSTIMKVFNQDDYKEWAALQPGFYNKKSHEQVLKGILSYNDNEVLISMLEEGATNPHAAFELMLLTGQEWDFENKRCLGPLRNDNRVNDIGNKREWLQVHNKPVFYPYWSMINQEETIQLYELKDELDGVYSFDIPVYSFLDADYWNLRLNNPDAITPEYFAQKQSYYERMFERDVRVLKFKKDPMWYTKAEQKLAKKTKRPITITMQELLQEIPEISHLVPN